MAARVTKSRRVRIQTGETAIAPNVGDAHGFGIENRSGRALIVWFRYDSETHVQTVVVEREPPGRRTAGSERFSVPV